MRGRSVPVAMVIGGGQGLAAAIYAQERAGVVNRWLLVAMVCSVLFAAGLLLLVDDWRVRRARARLAEGVARDRAAALARFRRNSRGQ